VSGPGALQRMAYLSIYLSACPSVRLSRNPMRGRLRVYQQHRGF
jgi:hypothetical protein